MERRGVVGTDPKDSIARLRKFLRESIEPDKTLDSFDLRSLLSGWECTTCGSVIKSDRSLQWVQFLGGQSSGKSTLITLMIRDALENYAPWCDLATERIDDINLEGLLYRNEQLLPTLPHDTPRIMPEQHWLYPQHRPRPFEHGSRNAGEQVPRGKSLLPDNAELAQEIPTQEIPGGIQARAGRDAQAEAAYEMALKADDGADLGLLILDMPGEKSDPRWDHLIEHAPGVVTAPLMILCVDPRQLAKFAQDARLPLDEDDLTLPVLGGLVNAVAGIRMRAARTSIAPGHIAVVVTKADRLERYDQTYDFPSKAFEPLDYATLTKREALDRLSADSDRVAAYLNRVSPVLVGRVRQMFASSSFHLVTSTGCEVDSEGGSFPATYPAVIPRRVRDPIMLWYLRSSIR